MPKTKNIQLTKVVQLFPDEEKKATQKISLDIDDNFLSIIHDGNELVLSLENWRSLNDLVNQATHIQKSIKV